jgi:cytochrome P450
MADDVTPTQFLPAGWQLLEIDPAFRADPHGRGRLLRENEPVRRDPVMPETIMVTAHERVRDVLSDRNFIRDPEIASPENNRYVGLKSLLLEVSPGQPPWGTFFFMGEPDHSRLRDIVGAPFMKRVAAFRPRVATVVDEVLATLEGRERFDVIADYAVPIPVRVIADVIGVGDADLPRFKAWSDGVFLMYNPQRTPEQHARCIEGWRGAINFFAEMLADRKNNPGDDLTSDLAKAQAEGAAINDREIVMQLMLLLTSGNVTTTDLIGNSVWLMLNHPEARARLLADPGAAPGAIEETLRYEPPATRSSRITTTDGALGGCPFKRGDEFITLIIAANRDPAVFADPDAFDIARKPNPHMTFGGGAHACLGAALARLEGQLALTRLFQRYPALRRIGRGPPEWKPTPAQRGLARLIVSTTPARARTKRTS